MALKQASRLLSLKTPLGEDLVLTGFKGEEGVSRLFRFELSMISDNNAITAKDIVGKNVTFSIRQQDESLRHFNGMVSRFSAGDEDENGRRYYRAEVVPSFWFLTRNTDCRIFENKTLKQIIEEVFGDRGLTDFKIDFKGAHAKREYCVQFRETDFNFLSRLMEEEGVWYAFKHEDGKHTMLIADRNFAYFDCAQKEVDYPYDFGTIAVEDHIRSWEHVFEFRSGKVAQSDYNFETPSMDMGTDSQTVVKGITGSAKYELFDYPGYYYQKGDGKPLADLRMEDEEVDHDVVEGTSLCRSFTPGGKFKIRQHRAKSEKGNSFVITAVRHEAHELAGYETGDGPGAGYENSFRCIPDSVNYRPQRRTARPSVQGVQTAVVIGDDEIPVDKYGRVRVRFPWDRKGKKENTGTCWVRVSQLWASAEWGGMHIPHKDDEVLVDFLDGDPDRPVIVGRVYNGERKVPLPLPAEKTKSIIRDYGGNETVMEGKDGSQFIHTQQTCGNEFLMDGGNGQEKIELRDKYGNEIILDAVEGTITLYSPTHESEIVLGRSINMSTLSDLVHTIAGEEATKIQGPKHENIVGFYSKLIGGWKQETVVGLETKINLVAKYDLVKAYHVKKKNSKEFETVAAAKAQVHNDFLGACLSSKLAVSSIYEVGAADINELGGKIAIHGEQTAEMIAAKAEIQAKMAAMIGSKVKVEGATCDIKAKTNIGNLLSVDAPPGKSPKSPKKRKSSKSNSPDVKAKKAKRAMQKASRRKNRGK